MVVRRRERVKVFDCPDESQLNHLMILALTPWPHLIISGAFPLGMTIEACQNLILAAGDCFQSTTIMQLFRANFWRVWAACVLGRCVEGCVVSWVFKESCKLRFNSLIGGFWMYVLYLQNETKKRLNQKSLQTAIHKRTNRFGHSTSTHGLVTFWQLRCFLEMVYLILWVWFFEAVIFIHFETNNTLSINAVFLLLQKNDP